MEGDSGNFGGQRKVLLNDENRAEWETMLHANLLNKGCLQFIDDTGHNSDADWDLEDASQVRTRNSKNRALESKAKGIILSMLPTRIAREAMKESTARGMYKKALAEVSPKTHSFKWVLLKRFLLGSFEGSSEDDCLEWIAAKEMQYAQLEALELKLPPEMLVLAIIGGLPSGFNLYIKDYGSRDDLRLSDVKAVVRTFFSENGEKTKHRGLLGLSNEEQKCDFCEFTGHLEADCMINPDGNPSLQFIDKVLSGKKRRNLSENKVQAIRRWKEQLSQKKRKFDRISTDGEEPKRRALLTLRSNGNKRPDFELYHWLWIFTCMIAIVGILGGISFCCNIQPTRYSSFDCYVKNPSSERGICGENRAYENAPPDLS
jgi:hypothetical protein